MVEILEGQVLELNHLVSFRGKVRNDQIEDIGKDMEAKIMKCGGKKVGYPITATFGVEDDLIDIELLYNVECEISEVEKYTYKPKLKIIYAVVAKHIGNPMNLVSSVNYLNRHIMQRQLTPITVGYNVAKNLERFNVDKTEIDIYVGVNPNVL